MKPAQRIRVRETTCSSTHFLVQSGMAYKTANTTATVQLVALRQLDPDTHALCDTLRQEAGRCWSEIVQAHVAAREQGVWLTEADLNALTNGGRYALHSQSVQFLAQQLLANVASARQNRAAGASDAKYPYREKAYQTVVWKGQAVRVAGGQLVLPNGRKQRDLVLSLPERVRVASIRQVALLWRADHFEVAITIEGPPDPPECADGLTAGVDLGEINIAAVVTERGDALVLNGRYLRSVKRLRNKRHSTLTAKLARCRKGSRRWKRLLRRKAQASAKFYRQQRHILHTASRRLADFVQQQGVTKLAIGDVRDIADGTDKGRRTNQKLSQWARGQFERYVQYKVRRFGCTSDHLPEDYSTRTCSACGHVHTSALRGRTFRCSGCGVIVNRDANGASNICSRAVFGAYGRIRVATTTYRRACHVVAPRTRARGLPPVAARR
jgi:putative transposase